MPVTQYTEAHVDGVRALNQRLRAAQVRYRFPESPVPTWLPRDESSAIGQEFFVFEEDGTVHGGYILKHQPFGIRGERADVGNYQLPLSEGLVHRSHAPVGAWLLMDALRRSPLLYALGIGSDEEPLVRMLVKARWATLRVPFFFRVIRGDAFLHHLRYLRRSPYRRRLMDFLAITRLGAAGAWVYRQAFQPPPFPSDVRWEPIKAFGNWADEVFERAWPHYALVGWRDLATLDRLYPAPDPRFVRLLIRQGDTPIGWAVVIDAGLRNHPYFGSLRLGTLVDGFSLPDHARWVTAAATRYLEAAPVDLIVTNQAHSAWAAAARQCGFLRGPSNFLFAAAPALANRLAPFDAHRGGFHLTRGDGDGPIHLT